MLAVNLEAWRVLADHLPTLEPTLMAAAATLGDAMAAGCKLIACGNGGSAAECADLCGEFVCRFDKPRGHYPAIALSETAATITAMSNDYAYDEAFARQVRAFARQGDVLAVFSTSGNSPSIRNALTAANEAGIASIAFLGKGGGACRGLATHELIVPAEATMVTARIQEAHKLLMHTLCEVIEPRLS